MAPILAASLTPGSIGLPRTSEDISIAHYTYKCLTKLALHVWQRLPRGDYAEYQSWVLESPLKCKLSRAHLKYLV